MAPLYEGSGVGGGFAPKDLQAAYKIPSPTSSAQTIALVDAYGYAAAESDLAKYREQYGLGPCTKTSGCFRKVNQHGEQANYPAGNSGWESESALDLDMASAACPSCNLLLVQANNSGLENLGEAVNTAAALGATEISNSYGLPEEAFASKEERERFDRYYQHSGVAITVSSGDEGYNNQLERAKSPSYPATSDSVIAVGGTNLRKAANARGFSEEVWKESGSGCSVFVAKPSWQADRACPRRMDNDVAAVAGTETPVSVYLNGAWALFGGTSVASPLVAGIEAHAAASVRTLGAHGFYLNPGSLFDVSSGSNGTCTPPTEDEYFCRATAGYDGPTGVGAPNGVPASAPAAPLAETKPASEIKQTTATLNASVNPNGSEVTECKFEYGTSTTYTQTAPCSPAPGSGSSAVAVSAAISGLSANTPYHFRVAATNATGTSKGADESFTTAASATTATFGKSSIGASSDYFGFERKRVNHYALAEAGTVSKLSVYLAPTGTAGEQVLKGLIYSDNAGKPEALLAVSEQLTFKSTNAAGWYALAFASGVKLAAGNYWIGVITGATQKVAGFRYDSVTGARDYNANAYSSGPTTPFGAVTTDAEQTSLFATYAAATTAPGAPSAETKPASEIKQTTATLNASVNPNGSEVTECKFEYGTSTTYTQTAPCSPAPGSGSTAVAVSATISGLSANAPYHFRVSVATAATVVRGLDESFVTLPNPATAETNPASEIKQTTATLNASVNPNGSEVTECKFEYGTSTTYTQTAPCSPAPGSGSSAVAVSAAISGLSANTPYHFRVSVTNRAAASKGADESFKTPPAAPLAETKPASEIKQTTATLNASVNPNGSEVTECKFEYGTSTTYTQTAPCSPAPGSGSSAVAVSAAISGLSANTPYHFRVAATNATGTSKGADESFTTAASATTATFGKSSIGASSDYFGFERKRVNHYALAEAGTVSKLSVYLAPTGTAGEQVLKGLIYSDNAGKPEALLAVSEQLTFKSTNAAGWYALPFASGVKLAAGNYWIGVITGATQKVAGFRYDSVTGSRDYNANAYSSGPTTPFGAVTTDAQQTSLFATYTAG